MNTKRRTDTVIPPFFDILPKTAPVITKCARIIVSTGCVFHGKEYFQRNLSFPKGLTIATLGFRYHRAAPATQSAGLVAFAPRALQQHALPFLRMPARQRVILRTVRRDRHKFPDLRRRRPLVTCWRIATFRRRHRARRVVA